MKKVLHVVTRADTGGISTLLSNYYRYMDKELIQFDIVAIDTGSDHGFHHHFENLGMKVFYMPTKIIARFRFLWKLIKRNKYDVVHSHIELQSSFYLLLAKLAGVKKRFSHAHLSRENIGLKNNIQRFLLNRVSTKRLGASDLSNKSVYGRNYETAIVVNNAVDSTVFDFDVEKRDLSRSRLDLKDKFVIGFVGRLTFQKNLFYLIDIFKEVTFKIPNAELLIVGDGEEKLKLDDYISKLDLSSRVNFLGNRDDIPELLMAMDVFLLPSYYEGLPLVLVEAQATSLPCFVSNKVTELVKITEYITYLSIDNEEDIKDWVSLISDRSTDYVRESSSSKIISKGFDVKSEANTLVELYTN